MMNTTEIEGYVKRITFRNEKNGYTVLSLQRRETEDAGEEAVSCVGNFTYIIEGMFLKVRGNWRQHAQYGKQFYITGYEEKVSGEDTLSMERYLGSGAIKGMGPALAARVVEKFAEDTFQIIEREPERLAEVKGISEKKARNIGEQFKEHQSMRKAMIFLQDYGISVNLAVKIYQCYGEETYDIIQKNPYRLAEDIAGIGFKIADTIAVRSGFSADSAYRIKAGVEYALQQSASNGHCYLPEEELISLTAGLLQVGHDLVAGEIDSMTMNKELCIDETGEERRIYSGRMYYMEMNCARMILDLNLKFSVNEAVVEKKIKKLEAEQEMELDELQKEAVVSALKGGVTIITGGPGTGKTTTINTILKILDEEGMEVLLAAPTGRAAKRMSETTGWEAQTIHRLLEVNVDMDTDEKSGMHFERNEQQPLEADVIIIDEFSMVDIYLFYALLKAIVPGSRLIMVGDVNQLPSVGPGNVLRDLIQADFCKVVRLNQIFRQAAESHIVLNAHRIHAGETIVLGEDYKDFFHLEKNSSRDVTNLLIRLLVKELPPYLNIKPYEIQVLTPMRKGELGVEKLNGILQEYMNPKSRQKEEREFHGILFREKDKIMQMKNDYQMKWEKRNDFGDVYEKGTGMFNGDVGIIRRILPAEEIVEIEFEEGKLAEYEFSRMDEVELAYVITIHKSQGSEYPAVVLPVLSGPQVLFTRNLLYTAVTRAKKCVVMVGSKATVNRMIGNVNEQKRYSGLGKRIDEMREES